MANIGLFYGTTTGNAKEVAQLIQKEFGADAVFIKDISGVKAADVEGFDYLIFGASTTGEGDLQYDFEDFLPEIPKLNLKGKKVAIFGLGDQDSYSDSFADAAGLIYEALQPTGATFVGQQSTDGYEYDESKAEVGGQFVGLIIDEENQGDLTSKRVKDWVEKLKAEFV